MIRVAIVDDEQYHRGTIRKNIERLKDALQESVEVFEYASGAELLAEIDRKFHIIFLDQKMDGMSGSETAKQIRKQDGTVILIFVTALEELWEEGYSVQAFYYLTKPIDERKFESVYRRAVEKILEERRPITFQTSNGVVVFDIYDIIYLEKSNHYTNIYYIDRKTGGVSMEKVKYAIKSIADRFREYDFVRPHVSFLVNPIHIRRVCESERDKCLELDTGARILISRERLNSVYEIVLRSLNKRTMMILPELRGAQ